MGGSISQLLFYDYRQDGIPQVIAVDAEGEVKGMTITRQVKQFLVEPEVAVQKAQEDNLLASNKRKIELQNKLEALKKQKEQKKVQDEHPTHIQTPNRADIGITQLPDPESGTSLLTFTLSKPGWIIKCIIIQNEVLFEGSDSLAVHPQ